MSRSVLSCACPTKVPDLGCPALCAGSADEHRRLTQTGQIDGCAHPFRSNVLVISPHCFVPFFLHFARRCPLSDETRCGQDHVHRERRVANSTTDCANRGLYDQDARADESEDPRAEMKERQRDLRPHRRRTGAPSGARLHPGSLNCGILAFSWCAQKQQRRTCERRSNTKRLR